MNRIDFAPPSTPTRSGRSATSTTGRTTSTCTTRSSGSSTSTASPPPPELAGLQGHRVRPSGTTDSARVRFSDYTDPDVPVHVPLPPRDARGSGHDGPVPRPRTRPETRAHGHGHADGWLTPCADIRRRRAGPGSRDPVFAIRLATCVFTVVTPRCSCRRSPDWTVPRRPGGVPPVRGRSAATGSVCLGGRRGAERPRRG